MRLTATVATTTFASVSRAASHPMAEEIPVQDGAFEELDSEPDAAFAIGPDAGADPNGETFGPSPS